MTMASPATQGADDRLDLIFQALADRTRRALLARLAAEPAGVTALAEPFAMSLNGVSKHLKVLERAGLIARRIDGRIHRCAIDPAALATAADWLGHYRGFWEETLAAMADYAEGKPAGENDA